VTAKALTSIDFNRKYSENASVSVFTAAVIENGKK